MEEINLEELKLKLEKLKVEAAKLLNEKKAAENKEKVAYNTENKDTDNKKSNILKKVVDEKDQENKKGAEVKLTEKQQKAFEKSKKWQGRLKGIAKVALSTALMGGATLALGSLLGIGPTLGLGGIISKLSIRTGVATGMNMAVTSGLAEKFITKNEGNKVLTPENIMLLLSLGIGLGFTAISGGSLLWMAGITMGSAGSKKLLNYVFDKKIKEKTEAEGKEASRGLRFVKGVFVGAYTMTSGLLTMTTLLHTKAEAETKDNFGKYHTYDEESFKSHDTKPEELDSNKISENNIKSPHIEKPTSPVLNTHDHDKGNISAHKLEPINPNAIVHEGGVTQAWVAQMRANPELANELGFTGDLDNSRDMANFTRDLAIKTGYIDGDTGQEVRVEDVGKIAYELKSENGSPVINERSVMDGRILQIHRVGDAFEQIPDAYESNEGVDHRPEYEHKEEINHDYGKDTEEELEKEVKRTPEQEALLKKIDELEKQQEQKSESNIQNKENTPLTEEKWRNDPDNTYHITLKELRSAQDTALENKTNLISMDSLSDQDKVELQKTYEEGSAHEIMHKVMEQKHSDLLLHEYISKLSDITGLKPEEGTAFTPAETPQDFIARALMKVASMNKIDEVKWDNLGIDTPKTEIQTEKTSTIAPVENHAPVPGESFTILPDEDFSLIKSINVLFRYNSSGQPIGIDSHPIALDANFGNHFFIDNIMEHIKEWSGENPDKIQRVLDDIREKGENLYQNLAIYDNIKDDINYKNESIFLESSILQSIRLLSRGQYGGEILDFDKLPEMFRPSL